jgi:hypothetical protein
MEVTVAMLLSAIAISICYTAYGLISNYYTAFHQKNQTADELIDLKHAMELDFNKSPVVLKSDSGITLLVDSINIHYIFLDQKILRKLSNKHTDTFKLEHNSLTTSFEAQQVLAADTIDQLNFNVLVPKKTNIPIQVNKFYSAKDLFN